MMFENQSNATSSAEQVVASDLKPGSTGERNRIISNGSAEDGEESAASSMQHQRWSKKYKALAVAFMLLFIGAVAFAAVVFRPGGLGNSSSIQSSQGQIFDSVPSFKPTMLRVDIDISEGVTYFESKGDKTKVKTEVSSDNGAGEVPGITPIPSSAPSNIAPVEDMADGSGELPPAPTENLPFIETPFPVETPIPTPMPSYAATESVTNVATGMGSGEVIATPFPMETPIPTPMPTLTNVATGMGSGESNTPIPTSMPSYAATTVATGMGSGEGTVTVSTETTGPPTLPNREPL